MYKISGIKPGDLANGDIAVIKPGDLANGDIAVNYLFTKMTKALEISGPGTSDDIAEVIKDIVGRYLKYLISNEWAIVVNRSDDFYNIAVMTAKPDYEDK